MSVAPFADFIVSYPFYPCISEFLQLGVSFTTSRDASMRTRARWPFYGQTGVNIFEHASCFGPSGDQRRGQILSINGPGWKGSHPLAESNSAGYCANQVAIVHHVEGCTTIWMARYPQHAPRCMLDWLPAPQINSCAAPPGRCCHWTLPCSDIPFSAGHHASQSRQSGSTKRLPWSSASSCACGIDRNCERRMGRCQARPAIS